MKPTVEDFIEHVGVKGMHWGVRKSNVSKKRSGESKRVSELRKKPAHELTNKQLKTINERMNLEQNFSRMNPTTAQKGKAAVTGIIGTAMMAKTVYDIANSAAGKSAIAAGKKAVTRAKHSDMEVGVDFIKHRNSLLLRPIS